MLLTCFGPDLQLGYFGLALPTASMQAAGHCPLLLLLPEGQAQATEQETGKGETFAGDTVRTQRDQGCLWWNPFLVCSLLASWGLLAKAKREHARAGGEQLFQWDFLLKTGIKGQGPFCK